MRFTFVVSLALNLLMLTTIVVARVDSARFSDPTAITGGLAFLADESSPGSEDIESISDLIAELESTSLGPHEIRIFTRSWVEDRVRRAYITQETQFWQADYSPAYDRLVMQVATEAAVRSELVAAFGKNIMEDPAFENAFRPLGFGYSFLSPTAQVALQRHQIRLLENTGTPPAAGLSQTRCVRRAPAGEALDASPLPPEFTDSELLEYELRFSPLAGQLRRAGIAEDESGFRNLFERWRRLEQTSSPLIQAELRAELRALMGDRAFDRFSSLKDPLFGALQSYLVGQEFSSDQVEGAYAITNRAQEELLGLMARQGDSKTMLTALSRVRQDETLRLTELLGERAARGLVAARDQQALNFAGQAGPAC